MEQTTNKHVQKEEKSIKKTEKSIKKPEKSIKKTEKAKAWVKRSRTVLGLIINCSRKLSKRCF